MSNTGFAVDDDVAQSLRTIERQRSTKRIAVLGGMIAALLVLVLAVMLGYSDKPEVAPGPQNIGAP